MNRKEVLSTFNASLSEKDFQASATCQSLDELISISECLFDQKNEINSILDLGCGFGGLTSAYADALDCESIHGIDLDEERRAVAEERGVTTYNLDLENDRFPFDDGEIDLILSFGVLEHLKYYDNPLEESYRVLRDEGYILYSVPNLGSWLNRLLLLFGNQPRDVEISQYKAFGISDRYPTQEFLQHLHSPTYDAFLELLEYHGFRTIQTGGLFPYQPSRIVRILDSLSAFRPQLCRRIAVIGMKQYGSKSPRLKNTSS